VFTVFGYDSDGDDSVYLACYDEGIHNGLFWLFDVAVSGIQPEIEHVEGFISFLFGCELDIVTEFAIVVEADTVG